MCHLCALPGHVFPLLRLFQQPSVGSHRVWACAILHMLLLHNNPIIDKAVHEAKLLPAAIAMSLAHERCSSVQCRASEMLRSSLLSSVPEMWQGLFKQGFDCSIKQQGSEELVPPLHESLIQIGGWQGLARGHSCVYILYC